ncbi:equilibrative nucleotide transporter 1 [Amborella trichopoda]|uniref:Uncharacterized protein n=1 Tax=Amborella trichopoda TaxID=13333 RepID=W1PFM1_AMBTC|nr:equilibrative nucleotide transporter 1 [Amborella trichopoda]ERN06441.1 hypothetical protein AMTR_s00016p00258200 [Amborella trichopoda]|eukprot:XP_006844766.1 equilibrative nucleotide transporter 1 [Amborella trichopoda]
MGFSSTSPKDSSETLETTPLNPNSLSTQIPPDSFHLAYIIYFILGAGFLVPWNAFITAVDYFAYLYPGVAVDRVFAVTYMLVALIFLLIIIRVAEKSRAYIRINLGLVMFVVSLVVVPVMDVCYVKGRRGLYGAYYVTVVATGLSGMGDALVQGSLIGSAGELPERYMQAVVAGTAASGVLVSLMRIITKSIFSQDAHGLRRSANLYFGVSIAFMIVCLICHNVTHTLPIIRYYKNLKVKAITVEEDEEKNEKETHVWSSNLWHIIGRIKWFCFGVGLIYVITLSIFPGYITEDVHSSLLKDWYPILLIAGYNVFDLVGKTLTAFYIIENEKIAVGATVVRLLFYPLFYGCLHGPKFFRTEIPVTVLTCLLGLTNGYVTSILMILAPKAVPLQHAEMAGVVIVLFLGVGLVVGSIVAWFWVI